MKFKIIKSDYYFINKINKINYFIQIDVNIIIFICLINGYNITYSKYI